LATSTFLTIVILFVSDSALLCFAIFYEVCWFLLLVGVGKKGNMCLSKPVLGQYAHTPVWNEEFRYRIEANPETPFLTHIWAFSAHPTGGPDTPL
jgi:hypothetical protein